MPNAPRTFRAKPQRKPWQKSGRYKRTLVGERLQRTKKRILERDGYTCQSCGKLIEYGDSILDHIIPIAFDGGDDDDNLQSLCVPCSDLKTRREGGRDAKQIWRPGVLTIICGPPGAGKSTYVREHKAPGDIVFDYDSIAHALGDEMHALSPHLIRPIESMRDVILNHSKQTDHNTWVIITDLGKAITEARSYGATLKIIDTPPDACIRRLRHDNRPRIEDRINKANSWWREYEAHKANCDV